MFDLGDHDVRTIHVHRLYPGFVAIWAGALQGIRVRQGYLDRGLRLHFNGSIGGQILRHRGSNEKVSHDGYELRFPIFLSLSLLSSGRLKGNFRYGNEVDAKR